MRKHNVLLHYLGRLAPPALLVFAGLMPAGTATAAIALDQIAYSGYSTDFATSSADTVFTTVGDTLLSVNVSNPAAPSVLGSCSLLGDNFASPGEVAGIEFSNNRVYVLRDGGSLALQVVDVSIAGSPELIGSFEAPAADANDEQTQTGRSMTVEGSIVYLGVRSFGVYRVNASNASDIFIQSFYDVSPDPSDSTPTVVDVASKDTNVFLLTSSDGVLNIDFSTPSFPVQNGGYLVSVNQNHIDADNDRVYLFDGSVQILDSSLPALLQLQSNGGFTATAFASGGSTLFSASAVQVRTTSIANPAAPSLLGSLSQVSQAAIGNGDLALGNNKVLLARGQDLSVVDVTTLSAPAFSGVLRAHAPGEPLQAPLFSNGKMYLLTDTSAMTGFGTAAISVLLPVSGQAPQLLGTLDLSASDRPNEIAVSGDTVYAVTDTQVIVINASIPQTPAIVGRRNHPSATGTFNQTITVAGSMVYTGGTYGVSIVSAADPSNPQVVGIYVGGQPVPVVDLQIVGSNLYCAAGTAGLQVVSVTNPSLPTLLSIGNVDGADLQEIRVSGNYCYARTPDSLLRINVSSPASPGVVSQLSLPTSSALSECFACQSDYRGSFAANGTVVYLAGGTDGLLVASFSNSNNPQILDSWDTSWLNYVALDSDLLYLAEDKVEYPGKTESGLRVATPPVSGGGTGDPSGGQITSIPYFAEEGKELTLQAPAGTNHQWRRNGIDMANVPPRVTGVQSQDLLFQPVEMADEATYTCVYEDGSKQLVETEPYSLEVLPVNSVPVGGGLGLAGLASVLLLAGAGFSRGRKQDRQ